LKAGTTIRKILFIALWLCIGGGMFTLLMAAISNKNKDRCSDYHIELKGDARNLFIDEKDVEQLLTKSLGGGIKGRLITSFNLHALELMLEKDKWIEEAELYFDNQDLLHIRVIERQPVARVFTIDGGSFYLDSTGKTIPLSEKLSARVPVFTGFPSKIFSAKDSLLLNQVKMTANYIYNDPFWMSQVAQIDITEKGKFEMIPVVGNHLVRLGDGENLDAKFRRLMIFYQQVLSKTGFEKYKLIDVQYKGQVLVSRFVGDPKIDSVQLRKNVEKLLQQSWEAANDTVIRSLPPLVKLEPDSAIAPDPSLVDKPLPEEKKDTAAGNKKPVKGKNITDKQPKAVMKNNN
jgi:cell division protein FtsQ